MNDRAVSLLEKYDIEVLRTWKGRGAVLCESNKGILIFKEYIGPREKVLFQNALLSHVAQQGNIRVESIIKNKEGELLVDDQEGIPYVLKTYFEGRECNVRDLEECRMAVRTLAALHKVSDLTGTEIMTGRPPFQIEIEIEKHNKELKKVKRFLKEKSQKNDFEIYLMKSYDYFYNLALQVTEELHYYAREAESAALGIVCHGDYQYHNILLANNHWSLINFEKCIIDNPVRDLYLFMRKLLEKSNWSQSVGDSLLSAYISEREMTNADHVQLYYRLFYPEKFWKIVNFYYNSGKAWIPGKNLEKMERLLEQEKDKQLFLKTYQSNYQLF